MKTLLVDRSLLITISTVGSGSIKAICSHRQQTVSRFQLSMSIFGGHFLLRSMIVPPRRYVLKIPQKVKIPTKPDLAPLILENEEQCLVLYVEFPTLKALSYLHIIVHIQQHLKNVIWTEKKWEEYIANSELVNSCKIALCKDFIPLNPSSLCAITSLFVHNTWWRSKRLDIDFLPHLLRLKMRTIRCENFNVSSKKDRLRRKEFKWGRRIALHNVMKYVTENGPNFELVPENVWYHYEIRGFNSVLALVEFCEQFPTCVG